MLHGQLGRLLGVLKASAAGAEVHGFLVALFGTVVCFSLILSFLRSKSVYFRKLGHNYLGFFFLHVKIRI